MTLQLSPEAYLEKQALEDEIQLSYFVKKRGQNRPRVGYANLLDISSTGLCMEISPDDSELYMETGGQLFLLNSVIEMQIFCRSLTANVSIEGHVKWLRRGDESRHNKGDGPICVGALFRFDDSQQRKDLAELLSLLKTEMISCGDCGATVSANAAFCYDCGTKLVRKRAFLRKILNNLIAGNKSPA